MSHLPRTDDLRSMIAGARSQDVLDQVANLVPSVERDADRVALLQAIDRRAEELREPVTMLTPRQLEVARLWVGGWRIRDIAHRLGVTSATASTLLRHARARLGIAPHDRRGLAMALPSTTVGTAMGRPPRMTRWGIAPGEPVRVVGGLHVGRIGRYVAAHGGRQAKVRVGAATIALMAEHIKPIREAA